MRFGGVGVDMGGGGVGIGYKDDRELLVCRPRLPSNGRAGIEVEETGERTGQEETETGDGVEEMEGVDEIGAESKGMGVGLADDKEIGGVTDDTGGEGVLGTTGLGAGDGLDCTEDVPT